MTTNLQKTEDPKNKTLALAVEQAITAGNLAGLNSEQKLFYYNQVCASVGLNPLTRPLDFIQLNGKLVLYAKKDATDQLRKIYTVSITKLDESIKEGLCIVTAYARDKNGKEDSDVGAVPLPAGGEARANAIMKAVTKAKRRVTLSICGMGLLDESELDTIPNARGEDYNPGAGQSEKTAQKTDKLKEKLTGPGEPQPNIPRGEEVDNEVTDKAGEALAAAVKTVAKAPVQPAAPTSKPKDPEVLPADKKPAKTRARGPAAPAAEKEFAPMPSAEEIEQVKVPFGEKLLGKTLNSLEMDDFIWLHRFYAKNGPGETPAFKWFHKVFLAYVEMYSDIAEALAFDEPVETPPPVASGPVVEADNSAAEYFENLKEGQTDHAKVALDRIRKAKSAEELQQAWKQLNDDLKDPTKINARGIDPKVASAIVNDANKAKADAKTRLGIK